MENKKTYAMTNVVMADPVENIIRVFFAESSKINDTLSRSDDFGWDLPNEAGSVDYQFPINYQVTFAKDFFEQWSSSEEDKVAEAGTRVAQAGAQAVNNKKIPVCCICFSGRTAMSYADMSYSKETFKLVLGDYLHELTDLDKYMVAINPFEEDFEV